MRSERRKHLTFWLNTKAGDSVMKYLKSVMKYLASELMMFLKRPSRCMSIWSFSLCSMALLLRWLTSW